MRNIFYFAIIFTTLLTACIPQQNVQTNPTLVIQVTEEIPTETPTPTATVVPTNTPEPSPTPDIRVIDINPQEIILEKSELPKEPRYRLVYSKPYRNKESAAAWGAVEGLEYIKKSGRVDGWLIEYNPSTSLGMPAWTSFQAGLYKTSEGPTYIDAYSAPCETDDNRGKVIDPDLKHGDKSFLCIWKKMQSKGEYYVMYQAFIIYKNIFVVVSVGGDENTFDEEVIRDLAKLQWEKIVSLPLSDTVTWEP